MAMADTGATSCSCGRCDVLDPEVVALLQRVAERDRQRGDICPRCMRGRINSNSTVGWCQPCTTEYSERILASKRRHYHRKAEAEAEAAGGELLTFQEADEVLGTAGPAGGDHASHLVDVGKLDMIPMVRRRDVE